MTTDLSAKPPGKKARTRATIIAAAGDLFGRLGIQATTMEDLATAAGLSVGALYRHFAGKDDVVLAYIADSLTLVEGYMHDAREAASPIERVYAAGDAYVRWAIERPAACRFAMVRVLQPNVNADPNPVHEEMTRRTQAMVMGIATDLKEAMVAGETTTVPIDESMIFLWALWGGVVSLILRQDGTAIPPELAGRALELARETMRRASAHAIMFPGPIETWPAETRPAAPPPADAT